MARCENCGKENPSTICASCLHHKKKEAARAAQGSSRVAPPKPGSAPDPDDLRDRMQRIKETLGDPDR